MLQVRDKIKGSVFNVVEFYLNYVKLQNTETNLSFWITIKKYIVLYIELES